VSADLTAPNALDEHGRKSGLWVEADPHGGAMTGEYVDGERQGVWRHSFVDGSLRSEGAYDRGTLHGPWTWYRASGGLLQRGGFLGDEKHGHWERWDAAGNLIDSGSWHRGQKRGTWTYFNPDGTIKRTTTHRPKTP
jgi:antitoxin component YwqK of YwqJK toxin-antitoxin module